jgi:hypothetical protein
VLVYRGGLKKSRLIGLEWIDWWKKLGCIKSSETEPLSYIWQYEMIDEKKLGCINSTKPDPLNYTYICVGLAL